MEAACTLVCALELQVLSSDEASKRGFLQRKGLTEAEISEALRRVPQAPPPAPFHAAPVSAVAGEACLWTCNNLSRRRMARSALAGGKWLGLSVGSGKLKGN